MSEAYARLRAALDGTEPTGFERFDDDQLDTLAAAITAARRDHDRALDEATQRSLSHLPRLLRPVVARIVGG